MKRKTKAPAKMTPRKIYEALSAPLAPEAYTQMDDGSGMTAINPAYRTERLNLVLGPDGWSQSEPRYLSCETLKNAQGMVIADPDSGNPIWEATCTRTVTIKALRKKYHGVGGHRDQKRGWAMAGAATAATNNALKDLIGVEIYKGLPAPGASEKSAESGEWMQGTLDSAYFSDALPTATIAGERMYLAPSVVKRFHSIWAQVSQRQDSESGPVLKVRVTPARNESDRPLITAVQILKETA